MLIISTIIDNIACKTVCFVCICIVTITLRLRKTLYFISLSQYGNPSNLGALSL